MAEFLTFVVSGLAGGASYALLALGLVLGLGGDGPKQRARRALQNVQGALGQGVAFLAPELPADVAVDEVGVQLDQ